LTVWAK